MQIDIPAHIEKLLFMHDTLVIPGFGGFTATKTSAEADFVGGQVKPPQKLLAFSENLTVDDGILVNDIAATHHLSTEDAQRTLQDFVDKMVDLLNQREIVTLPGVGRLYKNYVQKIQFLPDATNFNTESFGLPPLQFSPIARSREVADKTPDLTPTATTTTPPANTPNQTPQPPEFTPTYEAPARSGTSPLLIILGIALLIIGITAGVMWWRSHHKKATEEAPKPDTEIVETETPIRETPKTTKTNTAPTPKTTQPKQVEKVKEPVVKESVTKKTETAPKQTPTTSGAGKECILVVATLQEKANADRTAAMLKKNGYEVYFVQHNGFQVGVQFRYQELTEIQQKIIALQKLTGEQQIWIKKK
jgi:cell division septation protein DedD